MKKGLSRWRQPFLFLATTTGLIAQRSFPAVGLRNDVMRRAYGKCRVARPPVNGSAQNLPKQGVAPC